MCGLNVGSAAGKIGGGLIVVWLSRCAQTVHAGARVYTQIETSSDGEKWLIIPYDQLCVPLHDFQDWISRAALVEGGLLGIRMYVPPSEGTGTIDCIVISPFEFVMRYDVEYRREQKIAVVGDRGIKVRLLLSGCLATPGRQIVVKGAGAYLEVFPGQVDSSYTLSEAVRTRLIVLYWTPEYFTEVLGLPSETLPEPLTAAQANLMGPPQAEYAQLSPGILRAARDIMFESAEFSHDLRPAFLRAKSKEIACTIVRQLRQKRSSKSDSPVLSAGLSMRDVSRIHEARDILTDQFRKPPIIPKLALQVGLNQTKLKALFKSVFGVTIHDFVLKYRMERATELLATSGLSIAEIGYALGYEQPASFTNAFRKHFGHSPRQLRRGSVELPKSAED